MKLLLVVFALIPMALSAAVPDLALELQAEGQFASPTSVTHAGDGSNRLFITDQRGKIHIFTDGAVLPTPFLDISGSLVPERPGFDERGLLGLAFHPDYASDGSAGEGLFYVYYSAPSPNAPGTSSDPVDHMSVIAEFSVSAGDANVANAGSERILLTFDQPQFNHDAGQLAFGPTDEMLYISTGDGGSSNDNNAGHTGGSSSRPTNALGNSQDTTNLLGKILRIDPQGNNGPGGEYGIPTGNPFAGMGGGVREEIYAYGLRNPWRFSFDEGTGGTNRLFCADVGQGSVEEVNIITSGGNYGWRNLEGTFTPSFSIDAPALSVTPIDPIAMYAHPGVTIGSPALPQIGISVTGGYVYRGTAIPALDGIYIFADWSNSFGTPNGTLLALEEVAPNDFDLSELNLLGGNPIGRYIPCLGRGEDGELYVGTKTALAPSAPDPNTSLPSGQLFKIIAAPSETTSTITASKDNTIFSEDGTLSKGGSDYIFSGRIQTGAFRRALLAFDISSIPAGSSVSDATVSLSMNKTVTASHDMSLHRLQLDWGEGTAGTGDEGGTGQPAQTGDATWTHAGFNITPWSSAGGDYNGVASATTSVNANGRYDWTSAQLATDVQGWVDNGTTNFGWILIGNEAATSAKRFHARSSASVGDRPELEITYTPPLLPTRRQTWERLYFPAGTFLDPERDDDNDLIPLLLEYAWALNPGSPEDISGFLAIDIDIPGDQTEFNFRRDPRTDDLTLVLEASADLENWSALVTIIGGGTPTGPGFTTEAVDPSDSELRIVSGIDPVAPSSTVKRFLRLRTFRH